MITIVQKIYIVLYKIEENTLKFFVIIVNVVYRIFVEAKQVFQESVEKVKEKTRKIYREFLKDRFRKFFSSFEYLYNYLYNLIFKQQNLKFVYIRIDDNVKFQKYRSQSPPSF